MCHKLCGKQMTATDPVSQKRLGNTYNALQVVSRGWLPSPAMTGSPTFAIASKQKLALFLPLLVDCLSSRGLWLLLSQVAILGEVLNTAPVQNVRLKKNQEGAQIHL